MKPFPGEKIRIVTAASLFDGHDAAINIMRRILQSKGAEIIHLGHNRSVAEIVEAAIEEDVHGIAVTSYQGGHLEFFKYMKDLLEEQGCGHIRIFGGGGGTILPHEIKELQEYGIERIYSPDDGREMGLEGMIEDVLRRCGSGPTQTLPGGQGFLMGGIEEGVSLKREGGLLKEEELGFAGFRPPEDGIPEAWEERMVFHETKDVRKVARAISRIENGADASELKELILEESRFGYATADPFFYHLLKGSAENNRHEASAEAENLLWEHLRHKKLNGIKFRRQHIIDRFIADFVALRHKLIIEVDGSYHQQPDAMAHDQTRTEILTSHGFTILRFTNQQVLHNVEEVKASILRQLSAGTSNTPAKNHPSPSSGIHSSHQTNNSLTNTPPPTNITSSNPSHQTNNSSTNTPPQTNTHLDSPHQKALPPGEGLGGATLGITGTGGAGKSSVTDELVRRFLNGFPTKTLAVISVDPSKKKTGGALLGDRIRMNSIHSPRAYMRSLATRDSDVALSSSVKDALDICKAAGYDLIILESAGVGQSDASILDFVDVSLYVMTPEYGAASQLEKINMLDYADVIAINKFDKNGALDALMEVRKQYKRNHQLFLAKDETLPVIGTIAAQFNDAGVNVLFAKTMELIREKTGVVYGEIPVIDPGENSTKPQVIPPKRVRYLAEISDNNRRYDQWVKDQSAVATRLYQVEGVLASLKNEALREGLTTLKTDLEKQLDPAHLELIRRWPQLEDQYRKDYFEYQVRDKTIKQPLTTVSLSGTRIPRVVLPKYKDWGDLLQWQLQENLPGEFPYTAGVFPLKRAEEDPTRMFAGEGGPERTNRRFHYLSADQPAKRLSTAFDSVTLYGEDPAHRPDIFGKVGNSGVSIATVDDAKKLYAGFDLCDPKTSVSMTINGPAPIMLAFFLNAAIDQQCEKWLYENNQQHRIEELFSEKYGTTFNRPVYHTPANDPLSGEQLSSRENNTSVLGLLGLSGDQLLPAGEYARIKAYTLSQVRGTVQADILKEDQAQNTCIFSTEFALRLMGDVQSYFIQNQVRNFYSVSISGYHIAEAGANPITQLAFTLSNGFTYVEYYLSRGMKIDDFAPNLSFFFSNGMDPEYSVIGRVARRIWAKAVRDLYKGNERSQKLKYHIQTSGRSLHAQEIDFNDIRTTLQALYAIYDNCNSLHTNAYDEAITTPTEESVRRAMAIQLIINRELGTTRTENFMQGSFLIEEMTNLVEEAVLAEFDRISERGGVLGAMERMYQRNKIQEESLQYEMLKHSGELPIIGVNTFLNKKGSPTTIPNEVIRSSNEEKELQIQNLQSFHHRNASQSEQMLRQLKEAAVQGNNLFEVLMETVKYCSIGQITHALYEVGGQYRRNM